MTIRSAVSQAYFFELRPNQARYRHVFCGEHRAPGATWPNCQKPMLRMLSLDCEDQRLGLVELGIPVLDLVFCWTCNLGEVRTAYRLDPSGGTSLIQ